MIFFDQSERAQGPIYILNAYMHHIHVHEMDEGHPGQSFPRKAKRLNSKIMIIVPDPTAGIQEIILEAYTTLNSARSSRASCHQHELQSPDNLPSHCPH